MTRPIAYDATHLVSRLNVAATTGIDRVDLAYARHLVARPRLSCGVHYGIFNPHIFSRERLARLAARFDEKSNEETPSQEWEKLRAWLVGAENADADIGSTNPPRGDIARAARDLWAKIGFRLAHDPPRAIPEGAIYLNVAQHALEYPLLFDWLSRRPDVRAVFFVHDLLPLDYPEFFRPGYEARFRRRVETIMRHASAMLTTSHAVAERIEREFEGQGRRTVPIHVAHLPSPLETSAPVVIDRELAESGYFVVVSTLEPRKNHLMLLDVWRALAAKGETPKLVLVGDSGWENERLLDVLRRSQTIRPHVRWVRALSSAALRTLIAHSRALLMPSFAEGYGLPIVEAMSLGVPAIVSDIPAFREIAQGRATYLSPIDGTGWRKAVMEFADAASPRRQAAIETAGGFQKPEWSRYFEKAEAFLNAL